MPLKDIAARRQWRRAYDRKRSGNKPWRPGGPGRPPKGARMEPQCKLDGRMRAEHVYNEGGRCDCGARKMEFAPRPELRPEILPAKPKAAPKPAPPLVVRTTAPAPVARAASKPGPKPRQPAAPEPAPEKPRLGRADFNAFIADLERERGELAALIDATRKIAEWWPR